MKGCCCCFCLFVCLFVCSFVRLFVCSFVRLFVCSFVRLFVCSFVRLFVCSFVRLFVCSFVCIFASFTNNCMIMCENTRNFVITSLAPENFSSKLFTEFYKIAMSEPVLD